MSQGDCEVCGASLSIGDFPFCKGDPRKHERGSPSVGFPSFDIDYGEGIKTISSVGQVREIERSTMNRYKNEPDAAPVIFRAFSQDNSNRDVNTFGPSPQVKPEKSSKIAAKSTQERDAKAIWNMKIRE